MRPVLVVVAAGVSLVLTGCTATTGSDARALVLALAEVEHAAGHVEQAELLADGVASREDYDTAFRMMRACLDEGGITLTDPVVSPADGLRYIWDFDVVDLAPEAIERVQSECEERYWNSMSSAYPDTHEHVMEEALLSAAVECLREQGYELTGDERNFPQLIGRPESDDGAQREAAAECVFDAAHELYPELPSLSLTA